MPAGPGRPRGLKNPDRLNADAQASRCPACKSTERTHYGRKRKFDESGTTSDGQPFDRMIRRTTCCKNCGAPRYDWSYEFAGEKLNQEPQPALIG